MYDNSFDIWTNQLVKNKNKIVRPTISAVLYWLDAVLHVAMVKQILPGRQQVWE